MPSWVLVSGLTAVEAPMALVPRLAPRIGDGARGIYLLAIVAAFVVLSARAYVWPCRAAQVLERA